MAISKFNKTQSQCPLSYFKWHCVFAGMYYGDEDLDAVSKILAYSYKLYQWNSSVQASQLHKLMDNLLNTNSASNPTIEATLLFLANLADESRSTERVRV